MRLYYGIEGDRDIYEDTHLSRDRCQNWSTGILDITKIIGEGKTSLFAFLIKVSYMKSKG
ncbi:hypothetical protein [Clostridium sp. N3C]|uniref:hypothetical protein n=1 Tax=Clostridium sp. N3C TaxID=1776758 RepID=UPI003F8AFFD9